MALISNGNGTATDTGTGLVVPLTTMLAAGVPADGYQSQSTPAPTSQTDDTARLFGGFANTVITGGVQVATAAFGAGSAASAFPAVGAKPAPASAPATGLFGFSLTQTLVGGAGLALLADYFFKLGFVFKKGR